MPRGTQVRLLAEVAGLYEQTGLIVDGDTPPLWECCPMGEDCWRSARDVRPEHAHGRGGISLPWIGPRYRPGGVAVIAINLRDAGGLLEEYAITCVTAGEGSQLNRLAAGDRKAHGSRIAYASARSAAAIRDWSVGNEIRDRPAPPDLVEVLNSSARLKAVKCSAHDGERSTPTDEMSVNCPSLLLERELAILKPSCVLTLGTAPFDAIRAISGYTEEGWVERLSWGRLETSAESRAIFSLTHPAAGGLWDQDHALLLTHLRDTPAP